MYRRRLIGWTASLHAGLVSVVSLWILWNAWSLHKLSALAVVVGVFVLALMTNLDRRVAQYVKQGVWVDGPDVVVVTQEEAHRVSRAGLRVSAEEVVGRHRFDREIPSVERRLYMHPATGADPIRVRQVERMTGRAFRRTIERIENGLGITVELRQL